MRALIYITANDCNYLHTCASLYSFHVNFNASASVFEIDIEGNDNDINNTVELLRNNIKYQLLQNT